METRVTAPRLAEVVAREIEQRVLEGRLKPGDRLPSERELSAQLGVREFADGLGVDLAVLALDDGADQRHAVALLTNGGQVPDAVTALVQDVDVLDVVSAAALVATPDSFMTKSRMFPPLPSPKSNQMFRSVFTLNDGAVCPRSRRER